MVKCEAKIVVEGPYPEAPQKAMVRVNCGQCGLTRKEPVFDVQELSPELIAARANNTAFVTRPIFPTYPIDEFGRGRKCEQNGVVEEVPTNVRRMDIDLDLMVSK